MATYSEKAWAFVRKAKTPYTAWDLARIAQVPISFAKEYLSFLKTAKYIKVSGKQGRNFLYRTIKTTGVKPVRINTGTRTLIDENTGERIKIPKVHVKSYKFQQIWDSIRELKEFTANDIYEKTLIDKNYIRKYLNHLVKENIITIKSKQGFSNIYALIKDTGVEYPPLKKKQKNEEVLRPNERFQKIWDEIRERKEFTVSSLSEKLAEIPLDYIRVYIKHLRRSGYLVVIRKTQYNGFLYRLVRNSGEKAPILKLPKNKTPIVYDPNKNKTYPSIGD